MVPLCIGYKIPGMLCLLRAHIVHHIKLQDWLQLQRLGQGSGHPQAEDFTVLNFSGV